MTAWWLRRHITVAAVAALVVVSALVCSACGGAGSSATPRAGASSSPGASSNGAAPTKLDVAARLLVVRKAGAVWRLVRLTPATGVEETLASLPFRPLRALASPNGVRVLYWNDDGGLAVAEAATGAVKRISHAGLPIRSIDGATWTSEARVLFGGSRKALSSPEHSLLYRVDVVSGEVTSFRGLKGGEPSYATDEGSLIYVTRHTSGDTARETVWRLRSLSAQPRSFTGAAAYVDAGRSFDTPLLSADGAWILSPRTGTDVSVTYRLYDVRSGRPAREWSGGSPVAAAWGGDKVAFQQSRPSQARLAVFICDTSDGSLTRRACPDASGLSSLAWSPGG